MILTCPACETRYNVADDAVSSAAGRQVKCANCGHVWHFAAALQETLPLEPRRVAEASASAAATAGMPRAAAASAAAAEAEATDSLLELGSTATPAIAPQRIRQSLVRLGSLLFTFVAVLVLILARNEVVREWPLTAVVYGAFGIKTAPPGAGLDLKATAVWIAGDFVVESEITNTASTLRAVPALRVALLDGGRNELDVRIIDTDIAPLAPGTSARIKTIFEHPSTIVTDVEVTFATE
jgi:predicted Zn finger-like uncharacterized protein